MAAVVPTGPRTYTLVVLDLWEVRVAYPSARPSVLRHLLLRERPDLVVSESFTPWLRMLDLVAVRPERVVPTPRLDEIPELRRFIRTDDERSVTRAFALADATLTRYHHVDLLPEDRPRRPRSAP